MYHIPHPHLGELPVLEKVDQSSPCGGIPFPAAPGVVIIQEVFPLAIVEHVGTTNGPAELIDEICHI
jgi:hypothetical protein